jgi:hypothetical protein
VPIGNRLAIAGVADDRNPLTPEPTVSGEPDGRPPMALAMEWVSRILAVVVVMIAPGLLGGWLDKRLGTGFLTLLGFALGLTAGTAYLLVVTRSKRPRAP